jgi:hypothetical protein
MASLRRVLPTTGLPTTGLPTTGSPTRTSGTPVTHRRGGSGTELRP